MKKPFLRVLIANAIAAVVLYLFSIPAYHIGTSREELGVTFSLVFLVLSILNFLGGVICMFSERTRQMGAAMLLFGAIAVLCSFTLCSASAG